MSFTEMKSQIERFSGAITKDYQIKYLSKELVNTIEGLNNHFIGHLTGDILEYDTLTNFKSWLGKTYYSASNDNARSCLEVSLTVKHIYGYKIKNWTDSALKCYDNFLLKYIQEDRHETIELLSSRTKEQDVYQHLINKGGNLQEIGQAFSSIYQIRNSFFHVQILKGDGLRVPNYISNSSYNDNRDIIISCLKDAIKRLIGLAETK